MSRSDPLDPARAAELAGLPESRLRDELAALVTQGAAAAPLLQALAEEGSDKGVRKLARAALHRLRAAGAQVEAPLRADRPQASVLRPLAPEEVEPAQLSPPDPVGFRLGFLAFRHGSVGHLYHVAFSDTEGVLALEAFEGRWKDVRQALREALHGAADGGLVSVAPEDMAALVRHAELASGRAAPRPEVNSEELAELVRHAGPLTPGERARQTLGARLAGLSVADAQATLDLRLDSGLAVPWVFGGEEFEAFARELLSIERSPLVLSASQQRERQSERIEKFAESFFGEQRRRCLSERLEETGAAWLARADEDAACAAMRIATHLREARQPLEISLVRRSFDLSLEQLRNAAQDDEAGKLIVPA
jgi:hypothetical protein